MESSSVEPLPCPTCSFPGNFDHYIYPEIVIDFEASRNEPDGHKNLWRLKCRCSERAWTGDHDTIIIDWNSEALNKFLDMAANRHIDYRHYVFYGAE